MQRSYTSSEQVQVHRFSFPVVIGIPLLAIFIQAYLPKYLPFFLIFDLPLLVTIFLSVARRAPVTGILTGGAIGLLQDTLTVQPIGLYGIAKTVIGYLASSIGVKLDVENPGSRFLMTFAFYLLHKAIYFAVAHGLARYPLQFRLSHELIAALLNALLAVPLFAALDRFKQQA